MCRRRLQQADAGPFQLSRGLFGLGGITVNLIFAAVASRGTAQTLRCGVSREEISQRDGCVKAGVRYGAELAARDARAAAKGLERRQLHLRVDVSELCVERTLLASRW